MSKIEWTGHTWSPVTGCDKISSGCRACYAEKMTGRLQAMGLQKYAKGFREVVTHPAELHAPGKWSGRKVAFVCSMSDLFHRDVPLSFIQDVFSVMNAHPQHTFQTLTKRSDLLLQYDQAGALTWSKNIWQGVSVENSDYMLRIDHLRETRAAVKFLSIEPLLGPLPNLNLKGIDWVIVGGESSLKNARAMNPDWVREIRDACKAASVKFFFKQWGNWAPEEIAGESKRSINVGNTTMYWQKNKSAGRLLDGVEWNEMPAINVV